ncbi:MAG TPA: GNAT family N-acetyltransferase [Candidatus Baltobacteraceae bacterium]|nr:GNAT family N-acetyltransferase [Candidatus Baltobacteraceae bacterium]
MDGVVIRPAVAGEIGAAAALRADMANEMGQDWDTEHPGWRNGFVQFFSDKQARGDAQLFYAEREGAIVGMAAFSVLDEYRAAAFGKPRGWVNSVYVLPSLRRRGIAKALMVAGLDWLRKRGCVMARLRSSDEGRPLYEVLGFVEGSEMELDL